MCGRYSLSTPPEVVAKLFDLGVTPTYLPRFNIAPTQMAPVIRVERSNGHGGSRQCDLLRWGLIPHWADDPAIGNRLINAKCETAAEKPAFRDAFKKRRCLVIADGFYEWKTLESGATKQPFHITRPDRSPFALGGLWATWHGQDNQPVESFTILTTEPNALMKSIHNRMPVIVTEKDFDLWLDPAVSDPGQLARVMKPVAPKYLTAHPVSRYVNSPKNDDARCIAVTSDDDEDRAVRSDRSTKSVEETKQPKTAKPARGSRSVDRSTLFDG